VSRWRSRRCCRSARFARTARQKGSQSGTSTWLIIGFFLWLAYGIALHNIAIIIPNVVAAIVSLATILVSLRYR
jgi:uncharacterized protein with PQ loop repeat